MRQHYPLDPVTGIENAALAWANGNPATGTNGSFPPFGLFVDPQAEILKAQRSAGLTDSADGSDTAQLAQAISRGTWLGAMAQPATVNDLTAALPGSVTWPALLIGMEFSGYVSAANTGPVTVTMTGFATLPGKLNVVGKGGAALAAGDLPANVPFRIRYDGTQMRLAGATNSDTINQIFAAPARGILAKNTAQTVASGVATDITSYTTATNNLPTSTFSGGVATIGAGDAGVYLVTASFRFSGNAQAYNIFAGVSLNGGALVFNQAFNSGNGDVYGGLFTTAFERLNAGDQLKVNINQVNASSAARGFSAMTFGLMRIGA